MLKRVGTTVLVMLAVGSGWSGVASAAATGAAAVAAGGGHSCAIRGDDATVMCWGTTSGSAPAGRYTGIAAAGRQTCAVREADAGIDCWGQGVWPLTAPPGAFRSIAGGGEQFCGVHTDGTPACWGGDPWSGLSEVPAGSFSSVAVGENTACGVRDDRSVACWGYDDYGMATAPAGGFSAVAVGSSHSCGVRAGGGELVCWGAEWMRAAPAGTYGAVSAGSQFSCALRAADGVADCWGADVGAPRTAPAVGLRVLVSGTRHSCGVRRDDAGVTCWGDHATAVPEDLATGAVDSDGDGHHDAPPPDSEPTAGELAHELVTAFGPLPHGVANALMGKVEKVLLRYGDGSDEAACRAVSTLASQLRALTGKKLADTAAVRASLARIQAFMGCGA